MMRFAVLTVALSLAGCTTMADAEPVKPAAVAVAFDAQSITPLIVEGEADRATGRMVEANDPVRVASISKLIMALATLRLVHEGKISLTADVSDYLGWEVRHPAFPDVPVTLADILMHRSSLRDDAGYVIPLGESLEQKLAEPGAWYADAPPGKAPFEYANLGSPLVATVLEAASGERYDRLVQRTVFNPLGIEACFNWIGCSPETIRKAVVLYRSTGEVARDDAAGRPPNCAFPVAEGMPCTLQGYIPGTNASIFSPQGGLRIGMIDLARIGQALIREEPEVFPRRMMFPARLGMNFGRNAGQEFFCIYGLGMQVIQAEYTQCEDALFPDGEPRLGHAGEAYGLRSGLWIGTTGEKRGLAYFVTAVPDRTSLDEGGFAPEEIAFVRRAMEKLAASAE